MGWPSLPPATNDEEEDVRRRFLHMGRSFSDIRFRLRTLLKEDLCSTVVI
jgi:hypothetical protein